jgi:hypothetical protein
VSLRSELLRGAGAGTLAALALALFLLVLAPKDRVVSSTTTYEVTDQLARDGVTVVRPATVNESVLAVSWVWSGRSAAPSAARP